MMYLQQHTRTAIELERRLGKRAAHRTLGRGLTKNGRSPGSAGRHSVQSGQVFSPAQPQPLQVLGLSLAVQLLEQWPSGIVLSPHQ